MPTGRRRSRAVPTSRHTIGQRIFRRLYRILGPATVGPPPYATPEELAAYEREMRPAPAPPVAPPPGYRFVSYTDPDGKPRRMLVRDARGDDAPTETR